MFKNFRLLPDEVARQKPRLLLLMLRGLSNEADEPAEIPDKWSWFYGG
ncbi:MAG: hypothetical protein ACI4DY_13880 [Monoglobaceae bacterium]